jgi:hypothetical protein
MLWPGTSPADRMTSPRRFFWNGFFEIMRKRKVARPSHSLIREHFHFLGLAVGESDLAAIYSAAQTRAAGISDCEGQPGIEDLICRQSEIAVATYRLLDPRGRDSFSERVQLCYSTDLEERKLEIKDLDLQRVPKHNPWVPRNRSRKRTPAPKPVLMNRPVIERAIQEEASDPVASQAVAESKSWLDERREVVRSLRELEPDTSSTPFSWIRSVLGW